MDDRIRHSDGEYCVESESIYTNVSSSGLASFPGIEIPLILPSHLWSLALQQTLLFILIMGRWLLPKGSLTRDQLSQLLLVYIGIAADILEFSTEGLKMEEVRCDYVMVYWILLIWTWSLLQFTLGLTATKARKPRMAGIDDDKPKVHLMCCETEVWGLMTTIVMQDGPFLAMRLYILIKLKAINQMMIFFTCKNLLVMLLQFYRLFVIYLEKPGYHPPVLVQTIVRYTSRRGTSSSVDLKVKNPKVKGRHLAVPEIHEMAPEQSLPLLPLKPPSNNVDVSDDFFTPKLPGMDPQIIHRILHKAKENLYEVVSDDVDELPIPRSFPPSPATIVTFDDM